MIVKNQNLKFNNFYLFILFYLSLVIGFYFGGSQLIDRYSIIADFKELPNDAVDYTRLKMLIFALYKSFGIKTLYVIYLTRRFVKSKLKIKN